MLVLARRVQEARWIGDDIRIVVTRIEGQQVKFGIEAPEHINIVREEISDKQPK